MRRARVRTRGGAGFALAMIVAGFSGARAAPPLMASTGPFGDPFALAPSQMAPPGRRNEEASLPGDPRPRPEPGGRVERDLRAPSTGRDAPSGKARLDEEEDEEDAVPARPGTLGRERVKVPDPAAPATKRARRSPTSMVPDYEIPLSPKATLGGYSEVGRLQLENRPGHIPGVRARDLGGGLKLQFKIGE